MCCSPVAQLVEQTTVNRSVAGSSPARGATHPKYPRICCISFCIFLFFLYVSLFDQDCIGVRYILVLYLYRVIAKISHEREISRENRHAIMHVSLLDAQPSQKVSLLLEEQPGGCDYSGLALCLFLCFSLFFLVFRSACVSPIMPNINQQFWSMGASKNNIDITAFVQALIKNLKDCFERHLLWQNLSITCMK